MTSTDADLVHELQNGSRQAFAELYRRYKQQVYTYCLRMLGDVDSAQDVLQGIFLKTYERSIQIREPEQFRSWLFAAARHDCLSSLRRRNEDSVTEEELDCGRIAGESSSDQEESVRLTRLVTQALGKLPPELREVVILREYEDFSYQEIADITGVKIGLVKFRLFTARKKLAERLSRVMKGPAAHEL
jgi:RNA polymerase sigma-70 factor, ECF subfamily